MNEGTGQVSGNVEERTEFDHVDHIKVDHIEDFGIFVRGNGAQERSSGVNINALNIAQMCPEMLDKLDSNLTFLPELDMAIDTGSNDKFGFGRGNKRHDITVHEALLVGLGIGQMAQVQLFKFENLFLPNRSCFTWQWSHPIIVVVFLFVLIGLVLGKIFLSFPLFDFWLIGPLVFVIHG